MIDNKDEKPKKKKRRGHALEKLEVAIVKAMISHGSPFTDDLDILAFFTHPTRSGVLTLETAPD